MTGPERDAEVSAPGQAERNAEVQAMIDRANDPEDEYDGSDDMARALHEAQGGAG